MSDTDPTDGADFTLADLSKAISEKYKPVRIGLGEAGSATLIQTARLSDSKQEELMAMQAKFNELQTEGAALNGAAKDVTPEQLAAWKSSLDHDPTADEVDTWKKSQGAAEVTVDDVRAFKAKSVDVLESMLTIVAQTEGDAERLIAACNHDSLMLMEVFTRYSKRTRLGEASASSDS